MYETGYYSTGYYATGYYLPPSAVVEDAEAYSGGYFDYEALRPRKRYFRPNDEDERQAKPILEAIDRLEGPGIDTATDLELVLRLRLRVQGLEYKALYLTWLEREFTRKQAIIRKKRRNKAITLLLLH